MVAIERFFYFLDSQGLKHTPIEKQLGLSNGYLGKMKARKASIGSDMIERIVSYFPILSAEWLITGAGDMLKGSGAGKLNQSILGDNNLMAGREINNTNDTVRIIEEIKGLKKQIENKDAIISSLMKQQEQLLNQISKLTDKIS